MGVLELAISGVSLIVQVFTEIRTYLEKKKDKKIIAYPDQEQIIQALSKLNKNPEWKERPEVVNFFEAHTIIFDGSKIGVVTKETAQNDINKAIKRSKEDERVNKINMLPLEEYQEYADILLTKYAEKEIAEISSKLNKDYRRLLLFSIRLETLYKERSLKEADNLRNDIIKIDKYKGLKFCNLYIRGYLKKFMISTLYGMDEKTYDKQIKKFIEEDCKDIFFISYTSSIEYLTKVVNTINSDLRKKQAYLAVHSLGGARGMAKDVIEAIEIPENNDYNEPIEINVGNELSNIWYRDKKGSQMLDLIKDTILIN